MNGNKFKIISTLGPASLSEQFLKKCQETDQPHFRLNGSHLRNSEIQRYLELVKNYMGDSKPEFYLDLQGNKFRIGFIPSERKLASNDQVIFLPETRSPNFAIPLPHPEIFQHTEQNDILSLQDDAIQLEVIHASAQEIRAKVTKAGLLRSRAGILIKEKPVSVNNIPEDQCRQLELAKTLKIDHLAFSYTGSADDLTRLRTILNSLSCNSRLIAKIEQPVALQNLEEIVKAADQVWFCRGDLGSAIPLKLLGKWQDKTISIAGTYRKPVFVAGQVFQHLAEHHSPTRSEVVHFYHLLNQQVSGIVLSDETAIGIDPVNALKNVLDLL